MNSQGKKVLITGGLGFIGSSYARHLLGVGANVIVFDNFARGKGCEANLQSLRKHPKASNLESIKGDVNSIQQLANVTSGCDLILHAAAQVSIHESISEPRHDFESNALGTFNVLEAARRSQSDPVVLYTCSNKVYGIPDAPLCERQLRYDFENLPDGIDESFPMKAEEPYGASKAAGDLYFHAFCEQYGLKTVSFRCSCMFGPHQWGMEEQGWVAWFCIAASLGKPLNIYGDGKQVRDLLFIDDVTTAFDLAVQNIGKTKGLAINLGGGKENVVSLLDAIAFLESVTNKKMTLNFKDWRPGDNRCYYTNCQKARDILGWRPTVPWKEGVRKTLYWVQTNLNEVSATISH
jgi:CDP-paratose 2-epimerase